MARRVTPVDRVMGRLLDEHWLRRAGSGGGRGRGGPRPSISRMKRAGSPSGMAIVKRISRGGTTTAKGLRGQMDYIFNRDKVARIIDPSLRVEAHEHVSNVARDQIIREWSAEWSFTPKTGNTNHLILSYPRGTSIDAAEGITREVLSEMFDRDDEQFQYIASIHDDTDYPHAHVIVNRRGSEGTLFAMRRDSPWSYDLVRERMADHAMRYGVRLDPTMRFERGLTDRQPSHEEQLAAREEGRAPRNRARFGEDLELHRELVSWSQISYNALAVMAQNGPDTENLALHYQMLATLLPEHGDSIKMTDLNTEEIDRFDQYVDYINKSTEAIERNLASRDPADRVPAEVQLSETLKAFTQIHPDASYAKALHSKPEYDSLYVHKPGETPDAIRGDEVQRALRAAEEQFGLSAAGMTARIEAGPPNAYLERLWLEDDARRVARFNDIDLADTSVHKAVFEQLEDAHDAVRERLTDAGVIERIPHLQDEVTWVPPDPQVYRYEPDRDAVDIDRIVQYYKEGGASDAWVDANKADLLEELRQYRSEEQVAYLRDNPEAQGLARLVSVDDKDQVSLTDRSEAARVLDDLRDRAGLRGLDAERNEQMAADHIRREFPDMPHRLNDVLAQGVREAVRLDAELRPEIYQEETRLDKFAERSPDRRSITQSRADRDEVLGILKDTCTVAQYDQIRQGDLRGLDHLTKDPLFARQLAQIVADDEVDHGRSLSEEQKQVFAEHQKYVMNEVPDDRVVTHKHSHKL